MTHFTRCTTHINSRLMQSKAKLECVYHSFSEAVDLDINMTAGKTNRRYQPASPQLEGTMFESADFFCHASDLVFSSSLYTPQRGDTITVELNGEECVFEVLPDGNENLFHYMDHEQTLMRIFTKRIA